MLPTPTTENDQGLKSDSERKTPALATTIAMLPTPTTQEVEHEKPSLTPNGRRLASNGNSHSLNLADTVSMLPTPQNRDYKSADKPESGNFKRKVEAGFTIDLNSRVAMLPTPTGNDISGGANKVKMENGRFVRDAGTIEHSANLNSIVAGILSTPCQTQHKGSGSNETVRDRLDYDIEKTSDGQQTGLRLQPAFVEYMMELPLNWTSLTHETIEWSD